MNNDVPLYGLMAEFDGPTALVEAVSRARDAGYDEVEAFAPVPVDDAAIELGSPRTGVPLLTLLGGVAGAAIGYAIQYYTNVIDYPLNVGGRPLHSWPVFAVIAIESGILLAALAAAFGMLALNGLPRPHHPVFNVPAFDLASRDRFFLCIRATDPQFDVAVTRDFLNQLSSAAVWEVPS